MKEAQSLRDQGLFQRAIPLLERAESILESSMGPGNLMAQGTGHSRPLRHETIETMIKEISIKFSLNRLVHYTMTHISLGLHKITNDPRFRELAWPLPVLC
jgi:hypothetical protein